MFRTFKIPGFTSIICLIVLLPFLGCKSEDPYEKYERQQRELDDQYIQEYLTANKITNFTKTATGLYYLPQQAGTGAKVQKGNTVKMHYIGKFLNGVKFESSYDTGIPLTFTVGASPSQVIRGWDEGTLLMSDQEKATLIIPSHLGYGRYGSPSGSVPGGAVLIFDMTILEVK
ncbi:MAG: FKBP-type peptidyl-prolyl cis-trans isomerase [Bacteroidota bacterium]|nr:FKBP-type peptidyl-prolyl cis-trans isomerase [Bacteroidota bacterium]